MTSPATSSAPPQLSRRPRVLVRTLPLSAGNYGGILQAYAMQKALEGLGLEPVTDVSTMPAAEARSLETRAKGAVRSIASRTRIARLARPAWVRDSLQRELNQSLDAFVARHLRTTELFTARGRVRQATLETFDGFLAGSDQVWRAKWSDIRSYLFDFLPEGDSRPRLSYAASFGVDSVTEYGPALVKETATLAARLNSVSVRETSGIELCTRYWGVEADRHVDPTLLLSAGEYRRLAGPASAVCAPGGLVTYLLDTHPHTRELVSNLARELAVPTHSLDMPIPQTRRAFFASPESYRRYSVESWLTSLADARFIVTDSYHGTIFAIVNHVPFLTVANHRRGAARFSSLLGLLGLESRLIEPSREIDPALAEEPIDWSTVETALAAERERSQNYLRVAFDGLVSPGAKTTDQLQGTARG